MNKVLLENTMNASTDCKEIVPSGERGSGEGAVVMVSTTSQKEPRTLPRNQLGGPGQASEPLVGSSLPAVAEKTSSR